MTATRWQKNVLLAALACGVLFELVVLVRLAESSMGLGGRVVPWDVFPSWWVAVAAVGGTAWLCTRDAILATYPERVSRRSPFVLAAAIWGLFAAITWFSVIAFLAAMPAATEVSLSWVFRPLLKRDNLVSSLVVALLAGGASYRGLCAVGRAKPNAVHATGPGLAS